MRYKSILLLFFVNLIRSPSATVSGMGGQIAEFDLVLCDDAIHKLMNDIRQTLTLDQKIMIILTCDTKKIFGAKEFNDVVQRKLSDGLARVPFEIVFTDPEQIFSHIRAEYTDSFKTCLGRCFLSEGLARPASLSCETVINMNVAKFTFTELRLMPRLSLKFSFSRERFYLKPGILAQVFSSLLDDSTRFFSDSTAYMELDRYSSAFFDPGHYEIELDWGIKVHIFSQKDDQKSIFLTDGDCIIKFIVDGGDRLARKQIVSFLKSILPELYNVLKN